MRIKSLRHQRGAATVIGAIFLVVSLSLMATTVLYMASSDTNDSAMQNDAVEALFVAETGLEHAAYWFHGGTACASLASSPYNTATVGSGSFTITSAALNGTLCRVQVTGSVNQTNAVSRTVQGDINPGGNAGGTWAVSGNGAILFWNGTSWSVSATASVALNSIYCVSSTDCWAAGNITGGHALLLHWNGSAWSSSGFTNSTPNLNLYSVTCNTSSDCWAVGDTTGSAGVIVHWNGSTWSASGYSVTAQNDRLTSVTCVASTDCWAVGLLNGSPANIVDWNGSTSWSNSGFTNSTTARDLNGVDCAASNNCWAVGAYSFFSRGLITHWNGTSWSTSGFTNNAPYFVNLTSVSCISGTDCWAVGNRSGSHGTVVHWNGSTWSSTGYTNHSSNQNLYSVNCASTGDCWAVGAAGSIVHLEGGTSWNAHNYGTTAINGVFTNGAGAVGSTRLVQWQEIYQ